MSTISREDGKQFVIQAYRESLLIGKRSLMAQEIRLLAEQHGQYVCLEKKDARQIEAIFSREPGYLLGECVWDYFGRVPNLIYCEAMPDSSQALVVVVRSGSVFIDNQVPLQYLRNELLPLLTDPQPYQIYTSGNVPLGETDGATQFSLPEKLVASFEALDESVFERLPAMEHLQVLPLPVALKSKWVASHKRTYVLASLVALLLVGLWWMTFRSSTMVVPHPTATIAQPSAASPFQVAMRTPDPQQQLHVLSRLISDLYIMPGWMPTKVHYENGAFKIEANRQGGDLAGLAAWANRNHFSFEINRNGVQLGIQKTLQPRVTRIALINQQVVLTRVIDEIDRLFQRDVIVLGNTETHDRVHSTLLTINLNNASPQMLAMLGDVLAQQPIKLEQVDLQFNAALVSGTVKISVWGAVNAI